MQVLIFREFGVKVTHTPEWGRGFMGLTHIP